MARYKLTLAYDGTAFFGSQRQARRRTVQAEVEKAARKLGWHGTGIVMAGRTDAGVHAAGQVASLDLLWRHDAERLRDALNANLPEDLIVVAAEMASDSFHPRFDARSRRYRYDVRFAPHRHPLEDKWCWRTWPAIGLERLNQVAGSIAGRHDFGAFGSAPRKGGSTERTVTTSKWTIENHMVHYEIEGDGFLYRLVRRLVFVQVAVCQGKCSEEVFHRGLERGRHVAGLPAGTAPATGLRLMAVEY